MHPGGELKKLLASYYKELVKSFNFAFLPFIKDTYYWVFLEKTKHNLF